MCDKITMISQKIVRYSIKVKLRYFWQTLYIDLKSNKRDMGYSKDQTSREVAGKREVKCLSINTEYSYNDCKIEYCTI